MIKYKLNVLDALNNAGYSQYALRKNKILGESTIQCLREKKPVSFAALNKICAKLNMQPGEIIEYIVDDTQV